MVGSSMQFLVGCWTEGIGFLLTVSPRPPQSCPCAPSPQQPWEESLSKTDSTVLGNVTVGVMSHHLCYILLVTLATAASHTQGEGVTEGGAYQETDSGSYRVWLATLHRTGG